MQNKEGLVNIGMIAALYAMKKTLEKFPEGMSAEQVDDMITEIEQQLGIKETQVELLKRA